MRKNKSNAIDSIQGGVPPVGHYDKEAHGEAIRRSTRSVYASDAAMRCALIISLLLAAVGILLVVAGAVFKWYALPTIIHNQVVDVS